jgi:hypothetical protein
MLPTTPADDAIHVAVAQRVTHGRIMTGAGGTGLVGQHPHPVVGGGLDRNKYNRRRRQRALGKLTPAEFEMLYTAAEAA